MSVFVCMCVCFYAVMCVCQVVSLYVFVCDAGGGQKGVREKRDPRK